MQMLRVLLNFACYRWPKNSAFLPSPFFLLTSSILIRIVGRSSRIILLWNLSHIKIMKTDEELYETSFLRRWKCGLLGFDTVHSCKQLPTFWGTCRLLLETMFCVQRVCLRTRCRVECLELTGERRRELFNVDIHKYSVNIMRMRWAENVACMRIINVCKILV
jgi:hypothetical protein